MESDSTNSVSKLKCNCVFKSAIAGTVKEINLLCNSFRDSQFMKINRSGNHVAHELARLGHMCHLGRCLLIQFISFMCGPD